MYSILKYVYFILCSSGVVLIHQMLLLFLYYRMYSQELHQEITAACGDFATLNPKCLKALSKMETQIGNFDGEFIFMNVIDH